MVALAKDLYAGREDLLIAYERKILQAFDFNVAFADAYSMLAHHVVSCKHRVNIPVETCSFIYSCGNYLVNRLFLSALLFFRFSPFESRTRVFADRRDAIGRRILSEPRNTDHFNGSGTDARPGLRRGRRERQPSVVVLEGFALCHDSWLGR